MIHSFLQFLTNRWPLSRGRHFIFRNLKSSGLLINFSESIGQVTPSRYGFQIHCLLGDRVSDWLKVFGDYEKGTDAFFLSQKKEPGIFLDIGANVGFYSLLHASQNKVDAIWSFEPNPKPRECLEKSIKVNNYTDQITVFPCALSNEDGKAFFDFEEGLSGSGHLSESGETEVQIRSFSKLWKEQGSPVITTIKMDVEGHEWQVLQAMEAMLIRDKPRIVIELVDEQLQRYGASSEIIVNFLSKLGYKKIGGYELNTFFEYSF